MKRKLSAILFVGLSALVVGCSEESAPIVVKPTPITQTGDVKPIMMIDKPAPVVVEVAEERTSEASHVDTSVFEYARKVDVIDARELNAHLTVTVWMSDELTEGLASSHVLTQAWDFIQQDDVSGADTMTIGVMSGDTRVFQFTVDVAKFVPNEDARMVDDVLVAATVDKASLDVLAFAEAFEWRMNMK